jgi:hypothetical protein
MPPLILRDNADTTWGANPVDPGSTYTSDTQYHGLLQDGHGSAFDLPLHRASPPYPLLYLTAGRVPALP